MRRMLPLVAVFFLVGGAGAVLARQGPEPTETDPKAGSAMREAPEGVSITFDEPLDQSSRLEVTDQCGRLVSGDTEVVLDEMSAELTQQPKGHYTVRWSATGLAGASGTNEGAFAFHVYQGDPCDDDKGRNHNHNNNNGPKGNGHNNHGNKHGGNGGHRGNHGGGHDGSGSHSGTHPSTEHSSGDHMAGSHAGDGKHRKHAGTNRRGHGDHKDKGGHGDHGKHLGHKPSGSDGGHNGGRTIAEGPTGASQNDALSLLLVLLLPALLGTVGGNVLRARTAG